MCQIRDYDGLAMTDWHRETVRLELKHWHKYPVPRGGTVLDLGAGCGETAFYYLSHGAARVIAVESDPEALSFLKRNFGDDPRVLILPEHLDNVKIDIDGGEKEMILETHFPVRWRRMWKRMSMTVDCSLWRLDERRFPPFLNLRFRLHELRISMAHLIRRVLDRL